MSTIKVTFKSWFVNVIRAIFSFKHVEKSSEESDELDDTYFIDAKSNSFNTVNFYPSVVIDSDDNDSEQVKAVKREPEIIKVPVKPRDVLIELERVPIQWSLNGLGKLPRPQGSGL